MESEFDVKQEDSDPFNEDDGEVDLRERNWSKVHQALVQEGYREGISEGQDESMQKGFNEGYKDAGTIAFQLAECRGLMLGLKSYAELEESRFSTAYLLEQIQTVVETSTALEKQLAASQDENLAVQKSSTDHGQSITMKGTCDCPNRAQPNSTKYYAEQLQTIRQICQTVQERVRVSLKSEIGS